MKLKLFLVSSLMFFSTATILMAGQTYKVSINNVVFKDGDRIRSFDLKFNMAKVSVAKIPEDASILINNWKRDLPNWSGEASWSASVGAGQLYPKYFNNFVSVTVFDEGKFNIKIDLVIENLSEDTSNIRKVTITRKDFVLTPVSEK